MTDTKKPTRRSAFSHPNKWIILLERQQELLLVQLRQLLEPMLELRLEPMLLLVRQLLEPMLLEGW
jgi:hypothetical protein